MRGKERGRKRERERETVCVCEREIKLKFSISSCSLSYLYGVKLKAFDEMILLRLRKMLRNLFANLQKQFVREFANEMSARCCCCRSCDSSNKIELFANKSETAITTIKEQQQILKAN